MDKESGKVEKIGYIETGIHPRNFNVTPNGKYLLCACRDSNVIEIYDINNENGSLTKNDKKIEIDRPVCIKFI